MQHNQTSTNIQSCWISQPHGQQKWQSRFFGNFTHQYINNLSRNHTFQMPTSYSFQDITNYHKCDLQGRSFLVSQRQQKVIVITDRVQEYQEKNKKLICQRFVHHEKRKKKNSIKFFFFPPRFNILPARADSSYTEQETRLKKDMLKKKVHCKVSLKVYRSKKKKSTWQQFVKQDESKAN